MLLYENYLIFCRVSTDHVSQGAAAVANYQYKFSLPVSHITINTSVPEEENKLGNQLELWTRTGNNQSDVYILEVRQACLK